MAKAPRFFETWAMPFGATAAVTRFNRVSAALEFVLSRELLIPASAYFDDFTLICPARLAESAEATSSEFFKLIGWPVKEAKEKPFAPEFKALGVRFQFGEADAEGALRCSNTEERTRELRGLIDGVVAKGSLDSATALHLCGRLNFARSQMFGRGGSLAVAALNRRGRQPGATRITPELRGALEWWREFLGSAVPRTVSVNPPEPPLLMWIDGAHEPDDAVPTSCGAVFFDPRDAALEVFGLEIGSEIKALWQAASRGRAACS